MRYGVAILIASIAAAPSVAAPGKAADTPVAPGKVVFEKWCAACHAANPKLAGTTALQAKYQGQLPAALEARTDLTPDVVSAFVRNGIAWMAPFRKTEISDAELADLGAYLSKKPAAKPRRAK